MSLEFLRKGKKEKVPFIKGTTLKDILKQKGINTETVLVKLNNTIATLEEKPKDKDKLEILDIISGG